MFELLMVVIWLYVVGAIDSLPALKHDTPGDVPFIWLVFLSVTWPLSQPIFMAWAVIRVWRHRARRRRRRRWQSKTLG